MFTQPDFYGSSTVGERGQIVLPARLRKEWDINPGDKLLVFADASQLGIMLVKAHVVNKMLSAMSESIQDLSRKVEENKDQ